MYLDSFDGKAHYISIRMVCDDCNVQYKGRIVTAIKQEKEIGFHQCKKCSSRRAGKKTASKGDYSNLIFGEKYSNRPDIWKLISESKIGKALSEEHKKTLRKPKSKTQKIIEAANRPQERERRSRLMVQRLLADEHRISGCHEYVNTSKSNVPILCRSKLESKFLRKLDDLDCVLNVESAEKLNLPYMRDGAIHHYLPDFLLSTNNCGKIIVELKGTNRIDSEETKIKTKVLKSFCDINCLSWALLSERTIHIWLEQLKKCKHQRELWLGTSNAMTTTTSLEVGT